jgi:predicted MPP superfamily phosphohydrolase
MSAVTILHLSDLHYSIGQSTNISIIKEALISDLTKLGKDSVVPDIAIFSGDLVFAGENNEAFTSVNSNFLNPVLEALKLGNDKLFIAPGNHDISRKQVRSLKYVDDGLRGSLTTVDKINEFIDETISCPTQNTVTLDRLASFESFQGRFGGKPLTSNPFVRTYLARVAGATVGVGCFNTAWRATGESDDVDRVA